MAPGDKLRNIAEQAERDLNTYEAKTGHRSTATDDAGVDTRVEQKFPGAEVRYGDDLSTNRGYNKRIPPEEGGDLDARGRQTRGEHFEGHGGPDDKFADQARDFGGEQTYDPSGRHQPQYEYSAQESSVPVGHSGRDVMPQGKEAAQSNMQSKGMPRGKQQFKGSDYYTPESVPGSISAEGYEAPESTTQASRESEQF
ncbi:hypothetical protein JX265_007509 [Neoarthrinium moseri]|uniref:Uncharacterized protein n=1 Tax=Neoarthrinium moseri TaxID=1658444 RepID=A0A9P9WJM1_9PEZI|nr:uncharacterized protein JN550_000077 [Neoarthrinium moseri]KAI1866933.1 hypothetical protein JX265_007509 [Neoarthrinium moseri]KAI1877895.1 hypothetical protein JN550_000077 [Neoarthrinium moseri]